MIRDFSSISHGSEQLQRVYVAERVVESFRGTLFVQNQIELYEKVGILRWDFLAAEKKDSYNE